MNRNLIVLKSFISIILFIPALIFEHASTERNVIIILLFSLLLLWGFIRPLLSPNSWLFIIDGIIIFILEYQTRFVTNYFFHSFYILLLIEGGLSLQRKQMTIVSIIIVLLSSVKFINYIWYKPNAASISETLFHFIFILYLITVIHYMLLQKEGRGRNQLLYNELLHTHKELKKYMKQSEHTAILEERHRIARDIHDSVGHQLTSLIMQLEMTSLQAKQNEASSEIQIMLTKAKQIARESLSETRKAVNALQTEGFELASIKDWLVRLHEEYDIDVELNTDEKTTKLSLSPEKNIVIYRVIQESITNAIRHGDAKSIKIFLEKKDEKLFFQIRNSLKQSITYKEGFGMRNMRDRIARIDGSIDFQTKNNIFQVIGSLPINELKNGDSYIGGDNND